MQRILVAGITGSGKTTLARLLGERLGLPYYEMDAMYHGPGWVPIPTFVEDVGEIISRDVWVFDSHGYRAVRDAVWARADTVVWLDYSRAVVLRRVLGRSGARAIDHKPLFNGNVEGFRDWVDPEHPVQWSMRQYANRKLDCEQRFADPKYAHIHKVRIRRPAAARWWLQQQSHLRGTSHVP